MMLALVVGLGGGVGAVSRYLVDGAVHHRVSGASPTGPSSSTWAGPSSSGW